MSPNTQRRWPWYTQAVDAVFALAGLAVLAVMTVRNSYPAYGVFLVLVFAGRVSSSTLLRYLTARWESNDSGK